MFLFFFKVPATTVSYTYAHTLSLHYALPISVVISGHQRRAAADDLSDRALRQFRAVLADHFGDMAGRGLADGVELVRIFMRFEQEGRSALGHAVYFDAPARPARQQIGRASCRERVCQYVSISVVAVSFKKKYSLSPIHVCLKTVAISLPNIRL